MGSTTSTFTWDVSTSVPRVLDDGANQYVYGPDGLPLEQVDAKGNAQFFMTDQLGSTRALLDGKGAVAATYAYDAYGRTTKHTGAATTALQFASGWLDAESGFYYLINRYYDPTTAQFLSVDPAFTRRWRPTVTHQETRFVGWTPLV